MYKGRQMCIHIYIYIYVYTYKWYYDGAGRALQRDGALPPRITTTSIFITSIIIIIVIITSITIISVILIIVIVTFGSSSHRGGAGNPRGAACVDCLDPKAVPMAIRSPGRPAPLLPDGMLEEWL